MHEIAGAHRHADLGIRLRQLVVGCATAVVLLSAVVFVAVWLGMLSAQDEARRSLDWPTTPGEVVASEVVTHSTLRATDERPTKRAGGAFRAVVRYSYTVGGERFEGDRIEVFTELHATPQEAESRLEPYPAGASVTVHHDPDDPGRSVLIPGPADFDNTYFFAFGGGFLAIAIVIVVVLRNIARAK